MFLVSAIAADNVGLDRVLLEELAGRLMDLAQSRVPTVREGALDGLAQLARLDLESAKSWWRARIESKDRYGETASALSGVLGAESCAELRRALCRWLNNSNRPVRSSAIFALKGLVTSDEEVRGLLIDKLDHEDGYTRANVIEALASQLPIDEEIRRRVLGKLDDPHASTLAAAVSALGALAAGNDDLTLLLMHELDHPSDYVRSTAVRALQSRLESDAEVRRRVLGKLEDPDTRVREWVVYSLGALIGSDREVLRLVLGSLRIRARLCAVWLSTCSVLRSRAVMKSTVLW